MILQESSSEKEHFSTPFTDSEEGCSTDLTLDTYLEALSHNESWIPAFDEIEAGSAKHRDRLLERAVRNLGGTEFQVGRGKPTSTFIPFRAPRDFC